MTYFKHSSWKISTWLPAGCEQQGRLRELRRAVPSPKPVRGVQGPGWLRLPRVANPGGCFKPAAVPLAPAQPPPRWLTAPKALTPFPRLVIPRISLSLPNCLSGQHGSQHTSAEAGLCRKSRGAVLHLGGSQEHWGGTGDAPHCCLWAQPQVQQGFLVPCHP